MHYQHEEFSASIQIPSLHRFTALAVSRFQKSRADPAWQQDQTSGYQTSCTQSPPYHRPAAVAINSLFRQKQSKRTERRTEHVDPSPTAKSACRPLGRPSVDTAFSHDQQKKRDNPDLGSFSIADKHIYSCCHCANVMQRNGL